MAAPLRVPAARLRRVPDVLRLLQGGAARHPRPAHRADGRGHRRDHVPPGRGAAAPRAAGGRHGRRAGVRATGAPPAEIDAELATSDAGRAWLEELEKVKDPWFNMGTGDGLYHYYRSWLDDPSIPYASIAGHISALRAGTRHRAPDRGARARARPPRRGLRGAALRRAARARSRSCSAVAHGVPVRRGAQVLLRLLVPDLLVQQGPRVRRAARRARLPRGRRGRLPALAPRGDAGARGARAALGVRRPGARRDALEADRRAPPGAAGEARRLDPAAGARDDARGGDQRPDHRHALGHHARAAAGVGARAGRRADRAARLAGGAGRGRGVGPRS